MILINLLPHREAARKRRRDNFNATLGLAFLVGLMVAGAIYLWYQAQISNQQGRNNYRLQVVVATLLVGDLRLVPKINGTRHHEADQKSQA